MDREQAEVSTVAELYTTAWYPHCAAREALEWRGIPFLERVFVIKEHETGRV